MKHATTRQTALVSAALVSLLLLSAFPVRAQGLNYTFSLETKSSTVTPGTEVDIEASVCPSPGYVQVLANLTATTPSGHEMTADDVPIGNGGGADICIYPVPTGVYFKPNDTGTWTVSGVAFWSSGGQTYEIPSSTLSITVQSQTTPPPPSGSGSPLTGNGTLDVRSGYMDYFSVPVNDTAFLIYSTQSNASIATGVMNAQQFNGFQSSNTAPVSDSLVQTNGTTTIDGVLITPGTYYFVIWAYGGSARVQYYYDASMSMQVQNDTQNFGAFLTIPPQSTLNLRLHDITLGSPFALSVFGASNETVTYALTDLASGRSIFDSQPVTISNLTQGDFYSASPDLTYNFSLPAGSYQLSVANPHDYRTFVYLSYLIFPDHVDPYGVFYYHGPPFPMGITSYGVTNDSGAISTYSVYTNEVVGVANITALSASSPVQGCGGCMGLQENIILLATSNTSQYVYWTQDVMFIDTQAHQLQMISNIWNMTGDGAQLSNGTLTSADGGIVSNDNGTTFYYALGQGMNYALPLQFALIVNESATSSGIMVDFGVRFVTNGTAVTDPTTYWYDHALIHDNGITYSQFAVIGNQYTPAGVYGDTGHFYDAELVFAGPGGGATASINSVDANLGLFYLNDTGQLVPYPSYYSFGADTAETVSGLEPGCMSQGLSTASAAGSSFYFLGDSAGQGCRSPVGATTGTTSPTTTASSTRTMTKSSAATTTPSTTNGDSPGQPDQTLLLGGVAVAAIVVVVGAAAFKAGRRTKRLPPPPPESAPPETSWDRHR